MVSITIEKALQIIGGFAVRLDLAEDLGNKLAVRVKLLEEQLEQAKADLDAVTFALETERAKSSPAKTSSNGVAADVTG